MNAEVIFEKLKSKLLIILPALEKNNILCTKEIDDQKIKEKKPIGISISWKEKSSSRNLLKQLNINTLIDLIKSQNAKEIIFLPFEPTGAPKEINVVDGKVKYRASLSAEMFSDDYLCQLNLEYIIVKTINNAKNISINNENNGYTYKRIKEKN